MHKKLVIISALLLLAGICRAQPARLVIITEDMEAGAIRYQPLDGNRLPFSAFAHQISFPAPVKTIELAEVPGIYEINVGVIYFYHYATPGSSDTVSVKNYYHVDFFGTNREYSRYLARIAESDGFCYRIEELDHPVALVEKFSDFERIVEERKNEDLSLLSDGSFSPEFIREQRLMTDLRYDYLLLNKFLQFHHLGTEPGKEWREAVKDRRLPFDDPALVRSPHFYDLLTSYLKARLLLEGTDPDSLSKPELLTRMFEGMMEIFPRENREYALAYLLYHNLYWMNHSRTLSELYGKFRALYPDSRFIGALAPKMSEMEEELDAYYDPEIVFLQYDAEPRTFSEMMRPAGEDCIRGFLGYPG